MYTEFISSYIFPNQNQTFFKANGHFQTKFIFSKCFLYLISHKYNFSLRKAHESAEFKTKLLTYSQENYNNPSQHNAFIKAKYFQLISLN